MFGNKTRPASISCDVSFLTKSRPPPKGARVEGVAGLNPKLCFLSKRAWDIWETPNFGSTMRRSLTGSISVCSLTIFFCSADLTLAEQHTGIAVLAPPPSCFAFSKESLRPGETCSASANMRQLFVSQPSPVGATGPNRHSSKNKKRPSFLLLPPSAFQYSILSVSKSCVVAHWSKLLTPSTINRACAASPGYLTSDASSMPMVSSSSSMHAFVAIVRLP